MSMKFFAGAAFVIAMAAGAASAQSQPAGSYQQTCTNIQYSNDTLTASCKTFNGQPMQASLTFASSCVGDIGNVNGVLACTGPNGSYSQTCTNATISGNTLTANCKPISGPAVQTSLQNFQGFQGNISNCNGKLQNGPC